MSKYDPPLIVQCLKCREFIASDAGTCRFCGAPIDFRTIDAVMAEKIREEKKGINQAAIWAKIVPGIGLLLASPLLLYIGVIAYGAFLTGVALVINGLLDLKSNHS